MTSPLSQIFGVPLAFFGFILGFLAFFAKDREETYKILLALNLIGCLLLFLYTTFYLQSFCPYCFSYYILSTLLFLIYRKYSFEWSQKNILFFSFIGLSLLLVYILVIFFTKPKKEVLKTYCQKIEIPLPLGIALEIHSGPKVTIIGDFDCPSCKKLVTYLKAKDLNLFYVPYPLNTECNHLVKKTKHKHSCEKTYYALKYRTYPPDEVKEGDFEEEKFQLKRMLEDLKLDLKILPVLIVKDYFCPGLINENLIDQVLNEVL